MAADPLLEGLVPHAGRMCLLERILEWDAQTIRCATSTHLAQDHPLATPRGLRAVHLCEYGAQAMAVHGGLCAWQDQRAAVAGVLVSLREVVLHVDDLRTLRSELIVAAERVQVSTAAWQYRFSVVHDRQEIASGRATVALRRP